MDAEDERLFRDGEVVPLKPKALGVLKRLLREQGRLVTKAELLEDVWFDVTVGEAVLKVCVREIRAALDDDADCPRFIQTVHGRGYRFIARLCRPPAPSVTVPRNFVGRLSELVTLREALRDATEGESRALVITGEPGIGKTALLQTFLCSIAEAADSQCWILLGRCSAHRGQREPHMPLLEAIARICRGPDAASVVRLLLQCAPTWAVRLQGLLTEEEVSTARTRNTGATPGRMLREMADFIEMLSRQRPVVLCIEDLHWSDRSTVDLLGYLAQRRSSARLLLLCTSRSSGVELPRSCNAGVTLPGPLDCEDLCLSSLSEAEVIELLFARFDGADWTPVVAKRLHDRTRGNPLFLNSMLKHIVQTRSVALEASRWVWRENRETWLAPRELCAFIQHWLGVGTNRRGLILQTASVFGLDFDAAGVAAIVGADIDEAAAECELEVSRGFLERAERIQANAGSHELYRFVHPLFQQVLYESMGAPARVARHLQIARYLERTGAAVTPAELAHHYDLGEAYREALEYHIRAGESAREHHADHVAVDHLERALQLLERMPKIVDRNQIELGILLIIGQPLINIHHFADPVVERTYRRAHELCNGVDPAQRFAALGGLYKFFLARGHFNTAAEIAEQCGRCASEVGFRPFVMTAHLLSGIARYFLADLSGARQELEASSSLYDYAECQSFAQVFGDDPGVACLGFLGRVRFFSGDPEGASVLGREAIALARRVAHPHVIATALALAAHLEAWRGNDSAVRELADELAEISHAQSLELWTVVGRFFSAWVRCRSGDRGSMEELIGAFDSYDRVGTSSDRATYAVLVARVCASLQEPELALEIIDQALNTPPRMPLWDDELRRLRQECTAGLRLRSDIRSIVPKAHRARRVRER